MDWAAIIIAVIGGALGGLIGGLLVLPFAARNRTGQGVTAVFVVLGAIIGARTSPFWLDPIIGDDIREMTGQADRVSMLMSEIGREPVFATIFRDYPGARTDVERRLREAYESGGQSALEREFIVVAEEYGRTIVRNYFPRARNEDLLEFGRAHHAVVEALRERAPLICYAWLFDSTSLDLAQFSRRAGSANQNRLSAAVNAVIVHAEPQAVDYDRNAAETALAETGRTVLGRYPPSAQELMRGTRPVTADEQKIMLCGVVYDLYTEILAHPRAADVLRLMHSGSGALTAGVLENGSALGFTGQLVRPVDLPSPPRSATSPQ